MTANQPTSSRSSRAPRIAAAVLLALLVGGAAAWLAPQTSTPVADEAAAPETAMEQKPAAPFAVEAPGESSTVTESEPTAPADVASASAPGNRGVVREKTFDDLKFEMEVGGDFDRALLTDKIEALLGSRIRIRGYILPTLYQDGLQQFVLVRDNLECCFGAGAALYDCIVVQMEGDKSTSYTVRPITVEGTLLLKEVVGPDGKHLAIYSLSAESVR